MRFTNISGRMDRSLSWRMGGVALSGIGSSLSLKILHRRCVFPKISSLALSSEADSRSAATDPGQLAEERQALGPPLSRRDTLTSMKLDSCGARCQFQDPHFFAHIFPLSSAYLSLSGSLPPRPNLALEPP